MCVQVLHSCTNWKCMVHDHCAFSIGVIRGYSPVGVVSVPNTNDKRTTPLHKQVHLCSSLIIVGRKSFPITKLLVKSQPLFLSYNYQ